ncbi:MAG: right-handed parallel beta-helix repeat-containing protein [Phycisphaerales bacterium]
MKSSHRRVITISTAVLALAAGAGLLIAGPLNPPGGAVSSSYKTLTEVEPRIAINATNTPGGANSVYKITQRGSYYLTGNITVPTNSYAIEITANDVTIDLNGFSVSTAISSLSGIYSTGTNCTIRNGTVRGFAGSGVDFNAAGANVENVTVDSCGSSGIRVGVRSFVSQCLTQNNTLYGIYADSGSRIRGCTSSQSGVVGIYISSGSFAESCISYSNTGDGFSTSDGAVIRDCTAYYNGGNGFGVSWGITITGCTSHSNAGHGFSFGSYCDIENNSARGNGSSPSSVGAGFYSASGNTASTVRNNCARQNEIGFKIDGTNSLLAGNSASASSTSNYQIVAGNRVAQVVLLATNAAINGNSGGTVVSSPDANFAY